MRNHIALGLVGGPLMGITARAAGASQPSAPPTIAIRIVDYAQVPPDAIAQAQRLVSDLYDVVGVGTRWAATVRPKDDAACEGEAVGPGELFVIILTEDMSRRRVFHDGVIGTAAVSLSEGGRVAYVLLDRVWRVALNANSDVTEVMGLVIAHEVGHLLLPASPHSHDGLMRASWTLGDLREGREQFQFTHAEADEIRRTVVRRFP